MIEVRRYKCDYCRKLLVDYNRMREHERACIHNPLSVNCYRCNHAYMGEYDEEYTDGYVHTRKDVAMCSISEEMLTKNEAADCGDFMRSDEMYYTRSLGE